MRRTSSRRRRSSKLDSGWTLDLALQALDARDAGDARLDVGLAVRLVDRAAQQHHAVLDPGLDAVVHRVPGVAQDPVLDVLADLRVLALDVGHDADVVHDRLRLLARRALGGERRVHPRRDAVERHRALVDAHPHVGGGVHLRPREPLLDLALRRRVVRSCAAPAPRITLTAASATAALRRALSSLPSKLVICKRLLRSEPGRSRPGLDSHGRSKRRCQRATRATPRGIVGESHAPARASVVESGRASASGVARRGRACAASRAAQRSSQNVERLRAAARSDRGATPCAGRSRGRRSRASPSRRPRRRPARRELAVLAAGREQERGAVLGEEVERTVGVDAARRCGRAAPVRCCQSSAPVLASRQVKTPPLSAIA